MEYLDPKKQARHRILLFTGYIFIAVAIVIATLVLVYQAYGFGLGKNGNVIQNGLVFFSSQPRTANITLNGELNKEKTNSRLVLPEGVYQVKLTRDGYRSWERKIELNGGQVEHFDYPFLIPQTLATTKVQSYAAPPSLLTQSPDRRWLLIQQAADTTKFDIYDLKNPKDPPQVATLPASLATKSATPGERWEAAEWADDNKHVLLEHHFEGKVEYLLIDREDIQQSRNLSTELALPAVEVSLRDKKYDLYYTYDATSKVLRTAGLNEPTSATVMSDVLAFKPYGKDTVLYATGAGAPSGRVVVRLKDGDKTYTLRMLQAGTTYLLDLAKYSNDLYVAAGGPVGDRVYVYKDPIGQINKLPQQNPVPAQVLRVPQVSHLGFSASAQFVVAQNATHFGVYDFENETGYNYTTHETVDPPQAQANWMDGNRLLYISAGKLRMFDYDYANKQTLVEAHSGYRPAFTPDYKYLYVLTTVPGSGELQLTQTALLRPEDL